MNHTTTMKKFPIEIVNKILMYAGELNNDVVIIQYAPSSYKEFYKINILSDSLRSIQGLLCMKRLYPLMYTSTNITSKSNKELYKWGKAHYANLQINKKLKL